MTPSERLSEIEAKVADERNFGWQRGDWSGLLLEDIPWLVERVKGLEAALVRIEGRNGPHRDEHIQPGSIVDVCRRALSGEAS